MCHVSMHARKAPAVLLRTKRQGAKLRSEYMHAPFEATGLPDESCDLVTASFVIHECPPYAIRGLIQEARRLVRPGGVLMLADNNPKYAAPHNSCLQGWAERDLVRRCLLNAAHACFL